MVPDLDNRQFSLPQKVYSIPVEFILFSVVYWSIFVFFGELYLAADAIHYHSFFANILTDWSLNQSDEFSRVPDLSPFAKTFLVLPSGYAENPFAFGSSLLQFPFLLIAYGFDHLAGFASRTGFVDIYTHPYLIATSFSAWFYGWLGCLIIMDLLRWTGGFKARWWVLMAVIGATPLWNYLTHDPGYSHVYSFFAVSCFYHWWFAPGNKDSFIGGILGGSLGGLVFLIRWQDLLFLMPVAIEFMILLTNRVRTKAFPTCFHKRFVFLVGALLAFGIWISPQVIYWKIFYDKAFTIPSGFSGFTQTSHWMDFLFSTENGLYTWNPVFITGTLGLLYLAWQHKRFRWLWLGLILQAYLTAHLSDWHGSYAFGQRRWVSAIPLFAIGWGALLQQPCTLCRYFHRGFIALTTLWNILLHEAYLQKYLINSRVDFARLFRLLLETPSSFYKDLHRHGFLRSTIKEIFESGNLENLLTLIFFSLLFMILTLWVMRKNWAQDQLIKTSGKPSFARSSIILLIPILVSILFIYLHVKSQKIYHLELFDGLKAADGIGNLRLQRIGPEEVFTGQVYPLVLSPGESVHAKSRNPCLVKELVLVAHVETDHILASEGAPLLEICLETSDYAVNKTLYLGKDLSYGREIFTRQVEMTMPPVAHAWRDLNGEAHYHYVYRVDFPSATIRQVQVTHIATENLRVSLDALSLIPSTPMEKLPTQATALKIASPDGFSLPLEPLFNGTWDADLLWPYSPTVEIPLLRFEPGEILFKDHIQFRLSNEKKILTTGLYHPLVFSTHWNAVRCSAVHFLLSATGFSKPANGNRLAVIRLFFSNGAIQEFPVIVGTDVREQDQNLQTIPIPVEKALDVKGQSSIPLIYKMCHFPTGELVGMEIWRDPQAMGALLLFAATATE